MLVRSISTTHPQQASAHTHSLYTESAREGLEEMPTHRQKKIIIIIKTNNTLLPKTLLLLNFVAKKAVITTYKTHK